MAFHYELFPKSLSSLSGGPTWMTDVIRYGNRAEQRISLQGDSRRMYEIAVPFILPAEYRSIIKHHNGRRGKTHSFPLEDEFFKSVTAEPLGTGGGIGSTNQLTLNEGDASNAYNREIYLPKTGTIEIRANGNLKVEDTDYTLAYTGATAGLVTWLTSVSGQTLTWTGSFYVPVRYDLDQLPSPEMIALLQNGAVIDGPKSVSLVEVDYPAEFV